jgi:hypothetical protein
MLARAAATAEAAGVSIERVRADAARFSLLERYGGAIWLCEGAFGLLGAKDDPIGQPLSLLSNISRSLKPKQPSDAIDLRSKHTCLPIRPHVNDWSNLLIQLIITSLRRGREHG